MIRIGTDKVRTGCLTCKKRRVKCDERRPECQRCIKAKRSCEGYTRSSTPGSTGDHPIKFILYGKDSRAGTSTKTGTPASLVASRTPSPPSRLSPKPDSSYAERRALAYFQDRAAWDLAGAHEPQFWIYGILPIVQLEPSVKHALVALSTMHEHYTESGRSSPKANARAMDFALNHYGYAIREVVKKSQSQQEHSFDCALITCGLFAAFECLQGHYHSAFSHAVSGIKILIEKQCNPFGRAHQTDDNMYIARTELTAFFFAFWRQILELGDSNSQGNRPLLDPPNLPMPRAFSSPAMALVHMELALCRLYNFGNQAEMLASTGPMTPETGQTIQLQFQYVTANFVAWKQAFEMLLASSPDPRALLDTPAGLIVSMYQAAVRMYLDYFEQQNNVESFDGHIQEQRNLVHLAEKFIQMTSAAHAGRTTSGQSPNTGTLSQGGTLEQSRQLPRVSKPTFSMSLGIVPLLFLTATRTTDDAVRDKALHLLRICNRKEGFWDSQLTALLVERTINIKAIAPTQLGIASHSDLHGKRALGDPDFQVKLENIEYHAENVCILHYAVMWAEHDTHNAAAGQTSAAGMRNGKLMRKRDFSERLAWGDDVYGDARVERWFLSEEVRPPLTDWEKFGLIR